MATPNNNNNNNNNNLPRAPSPVHFRDTTSTSHHTSSRRRAPCGVHQPFPSARLSQEAELIRDNEAAPCRPSRPPSEPDVLRGRPPFRRPVAAPAAPAALVAPAPTQEDGRRAVLRPSRRRHTLPARAAAGDARDAGACGGGDDGRSRSHCTGGARSHCGNTPSSDDGGDDDDDLQPHDWVSIALNTGPGPAAADGPSGDGDNNNNNNDNVFTVVRRRRRHRRRRYAFRVSPLPWYEDYAPWYEERLLWGEEDDSCGSDDGYETDDSYDTDGDVDCDYGGSDEWSESDGEWNFDSDNDDADDDARE